MADFPCLLVYGLFRLFGVPLMIGTPIKFHFAQWKKKCFVTCHCGVYLSFVLHGKMWNCSTMLRPHAMTKTNCLCSVPGFNLKETGQNLQVFFFFLKDPWNWPKPPHFCCYEPKWRTSCVLLSIASWDIFVGLQICPLPPKFYFVCWEVNLTSGAEFSKHSKSPIWVFADGNALTVAIYDNDKEMKQFHQMVILHILKVDIFSTHYAFYSSLGHWDQNPIVIVKAL